MPGSTAALALEIEPFPAAPFTEDDENPGNTDDPEWEWKPWLLIYLLHVSLRLKCLVGCSQEALTFTLMGCSSSG